MLLYVLSFDPEKQVGQAISPVLVKGRDNIELPNHAVFFHSRTPVYSGMVYSFNPCVRFCEDILIHAEYRK